MKTAITRRNIVFALVGLGGSVALARVARLPPFDNPGRGALGALLPHAESAERVGMLYLWNHPEEADPTLLKERIAGSPDEVARLFEEMEPDELAGWVWSRQQEDFREGRTVDVGGWILSQTEARLCALLHLD